MKIRNRVKLYCYKVLPNTIVDRFSVVVTEDKKNDAKREYERQGYKVTVL